MLKRQENWRAEEELKLKPSKRQPEGKLEACKAIWEKR
jgi:hypothetical protein